MCFMSQPFIVTQVFVRLRLLAPDGDASIGTRARTAGCDAKDRRNIAKSICLSSFLLKVLTFSNFLYLFLSLSYYF